METVNQDNNAIENPEKTFTQAEVNAIVGDRLKRDREKYADYDSLKEKADKFDKMEEANKTELQKAIERSDALKSELDSLKAANTIRDIRQKVAAETGVPINLLTADTEETCLEQAKAILAFSESNGYPSVRDGGELRTPAGQKSTRDLFAEWSEKVF